MLQFYNQGDAEKAQGIPVSPLMDRTRLDALAAVQPQVRKSYFMKKQKFV
jgi:hypothetical protein